MNNKTYELEAEIKKVLDINDAYVEIPFDEKTEFGKVVFLFALRLTENRMTDKLLKWKRPAIS